MAHQQITSEMRDCIDNCLACYAICEETINHCLSMGGKHAEAKHIRTLLDCTEICRTSAGFMLRGSEMHTETCRACADVCERCEQECRRLAGGDALMLRCADLCRRCAESCRQMASAAVH